MISTALDIIPSGILTLVLIVCGSDSGAVWLKKGGLPCYRQYVF